MIQDQCVAVAGTNKSQWDGIATLFMDPEVKVAGVVEVLMEAHVRVTYKGRPTDGFYIVSTILWTTIGGILLA